MSTTRSDFVGPDYGALTAPIDRAELRRFRSARAQQRRNSRSASASVLRIVTIVLGAFVVSALVLGGGAILTLVMGSFFSLASGGEGGFPLPLPFTFLLLIAAVVVLVVVLRARRTVEEEYRFYSFAAANGMSFGAEEPEQGHPGLLFSVGRSRQLNRVLRLGHPRFMEIANYHYTTGSGKEQTTHRWGYVAIRLGSPLPHIVLDAVGNNGLFGSSNLPASFDRGQRLRLEGDFDRFFALYCPSGYERDALYLFTPDIMARFIDHAAHFDAEIVDDWLFLYARRDIVVLDPASWDRLFSVVGAVTEKLAQWERWRDERLEAPSLAAPASLHPVPGSADPQPVSVPGIAAQAPPRGVANEGRRLKRGFSWPGLIALGAIAVFWMFQWFGDGLFPD